MAFALAIPVTRAANPPAPDKPPAAYPFNFDT